MSTEQLKNFILTVQTGDEAAEIFIIDSQFQRIAKGMGKKAEFKLQPGLYTVKIRVGSEYEEKSIALLSGDELASFEPIQFLSPAPLAGTSNTDSSQIENAVAQSTQVHVSLGEGSQLYLFARSWTNQSPVFIKLDALKDPANGLSLRNVKDEILVDFGNPAVGIHNSLWQRWSACNVQLDPGVYYLCLTTHLGRIYKQSVVASPGWQTQIFLLQRLVHFLQEGIQDDLSDSSIFMSRIGHGFRPGKPYKYSEGPDFRLTEMARQALINNRPALSRKVLSGLLDDKFDDPMLGIYVAHSLLPEEKSGKSVLIPVIKNLRGLLTHPHPDVEALALKLKLPVNYIFSLPPMLHNSWNYILEASVAQPSLVPENSFTATIAGTVWGGNPWLIWGDTGKQAENKAILFEQLRTLTALEAASIDISNPAPDQLFSASINIPPDPATKSMESIAPAAASASNLTTPADEMDDDQILHLVQALGIPRSKLEALMKSIGL